MPTKDVYLSIRVTRAKRREYKAKAKPHGGLSKVIIETLEKLPPVRK